MSDHISFPDFEKIDIRVGTVIRVEVYEAAKQPSFILWIDLGEVIGQKKSIAQLPDQYKADELIGIQVVCVVNFAPKQIGTQRSEVLTLGVPTEEGAAVLLSPTKKVPDGGRMY